MLSSAPRRTASGSVRPAFRTPTIVVVDPKLDDYRDWSTTAETGGAQLKFVSTAAEALRLSRTTRVDLWVVNTELPGLSGYELCGMFRGQSAGTAVYLVADDVSSTAERQAWQARATLFTYKPAHHDLLALWLDQRDSRLDRSPPPTLSPAFAPLAAAPTT